MSIYFHKKNLKCNSKIKNLFLKKIKFKMNRKEPSSNSSFYMTAKTMHGLEDILVKELKEIGAEKINKNKRAVTFYGNKELLYKSNLCLRTALRILKPISIFKSKDKPFSDLESQYFDMVMVIEEKAKN